MLKQTKLNESFSVIEGDKQWLMNISDFLKVEIPGAYFDPLVKRGFKSPYHYFTTVQDNKLLLMNGHLELLSNFGLNPIEKNNEFNEEDVDSFIKEISNKLPFQPHDFQITSFKESVMNGTQINRMCTGSGKSLTISMIAEFFRRMGKKGLLLVPNINLLTQFKNDIKDYKLEELHDDIHIIGGGKTVRHFDNALTISTWQSMQDRSQVDLSDLDFVIVDEVHRFASTETSAIVRETLKCKYKLGFTGTIPEDPVAKMQLFGLFGLPKTYIRSSELIERGLATPISIQQINLIYPEEDKKQFKAISFKNKTNAYAKQLSYIKEHTARHNVIINLIEKLRKKGGNNLVLFQHTDHGKAIFYDTMAKLYPDVEVQNKDITGKKSFEFQEKYGIYFLNGEDNAETREKTRNILENHEDAILIANYSLLSTGVNIKKLHYMVLASPLKAFTTVTQSIGRLMRLHESKSIAYVFDIVDNFAPFLKQFKHRVESSYMPEDFPIKTIEMTLSSE